MATFPNGAIPVTGYIGLTNPSDTYATHVDILGWGGKMSVATVAERDAIPSARRKFGMMVTVNADPTPANNKTYRLNNTALGGTNDTITDNANWTEFSSGSGTTITGENGITVSGGIAKLGNTLNQASTIIEGAVGQVFSIRNAGNTVGITTTWAAGSASTVELRASTGYISIGNTVNIMSGVAAIEMPTGQILFKYNSGVLLNAVSDKVEINKNLRLAPMTGVTGAVEEGNLYLNSNLKDFMGYVNGAWVGLTRPQIVVSAATSLTPTEADRNKIYYLTANTPITVTLNNLSVGHTVSYVLVGTGPVTFNAGSGLTYAGVANTLSTQDAQATMVQKTATEWTGFGALGSVGSGYITIENNGTALPARSALNVISGLVAEDVGGKTTIKLGGNALTAATTIATNNFDLTLQTGSSGRRSRYALTTGMADLQHYASNGDSAILTVSDSADITSTSWFIGIGATTKRFQMISNVSGITVTDSVSNLGLVYAADYTANFTLRSITDKAYQDSKLGGKNLPAPVLANNGQALRWNNTGNTWEFFTPGSGSGGGSVTSFSAGNLSPLFTTSVTDSTTTPALSFNLSTQTANRVFAGPASGASAAPTFRVLVPADMPYVFKTVSATTYTFLEADNGYIILFTAAAGCTANIPTGLSTGWRVHAFRDSGAGTITFTSSGTFQSAGTTLTVAKTSATIWHTGSNLHFAVGAFGSSGGGGASYTFNNGLTESGGVAKLGGPLLQNTDITGTFNLGLGTSASPLRKLTSVQQGDSESGEETWFLNRRSTTVGHGAASMQMNSTTTGSTASIGAAVVESGPSYSQKAGINATYSSGESSINVVATNNGATKRITLLFESTTSKATISSAASWAGLEYGTGAGSTAPTLGTNSLPPRSYVDANFLGLPLAAPGAPQIGQSIRWNTGGTAWEYFTPSGGSLADGDKGDITVASSGTSWTIDLNIAKAWTGVQSFASGNLQVRNPANTFAYNFTAAAIAAARTITLPLLTGNDTMVTEAFTQTLTNKTLTSPIINTQVTTASTSLTLWNTTATTVTEFGAATTYTVGGTPTGALTANFFANATAAATTKTINIGTAGVSTSITNINIGSAVSGALGTITLGGATVKLQNAPAADAGFSTSQILVRDSSGNIDVLPASGGGTTTFLRADGTWVAPAGGGGGISNSAAANEMMKSDGTNAVSSGIFSTTAGNLTLGIDAGTNRTILAGSSGANASLTLNTQGTGGISLDANSGAGNISLLGNAVIITSLGNALSLGSTTATLGTSSGAVTLNIGPTVGNTTSTIQATSGSAGANNGTGISIKAGIAWGSSGNGNGGNVLIQSGQRYTSGAGVDGNIELDSLTGFIKLTTVLANDDALSQVLVRDGSTGYLKYKSALSFGGIQVKNITIESPTASENITMFFTTKAITITQINDVIKGSTSVTWNIKFASARDAGSPTSLFSSDRATTSVAGSSTTSFTNASIPANSWVWVTTSAIGGTPTELAVTLTYTQQ